MSAETRSTLKSYFNTGDNPTEAEFIDLIDSGLNLTDGGTVAGATTFSTGLNCNSHITASGNISASGTIFASRFESAGASNEVISFNDNLNVTGNITASGNISASGKLIGGGLNINGTTTFNDGNITNVGSITLDGINDDATSGDTNIALTGTTLNIEVGGENFLDTTGTTAKFSTNITSSGNISSSGTITSNNLEINGTLTRLTPETIIDWDYITCPTPTVSFHSGAGGAQGVLADGELFSMIFGGKNGQTTACQVSHVGAYAADGNGFFVEGTIPAIDTNLTFTGLNLQGATADNTGLEIIFGGTQFGGHAACTVGTHALTFDATFNSQDFTDHDAVTIGFRKIEEFETGHGAILAAASGDPLYTDFVAFGVQSPDDVQIATRLNDGTTVFKDSGESTPAGANHRFKINITTGGVVTFSHIKNNSMNAGTLAAPSATTAFTFDDGDVIVPYLIVQNTAADSKIHLKSIKITRTPGISYVD